TGNSRKTNSPFVATHVTSRKAPAVSANIKSKPICDHLAGGAMVGVVPSRHSYFFGSQQSICRIEARSYLASTPFAASPCHDSSAATPFLVIALDALVKTTSPYSVKL